MKEVGEQFTGLASWLVKLPRSQESRHEIWQERYCESPLDRSLFAGGS